MLFVGVLLATYRCRKLGLSGPIPDDSTTMVRAHKTDGTDNRADRMMRKETAMAGSTRMAWSSVAAFCCALLLYGSARAEPVDVRFSSVPFIGSVPTSVAHENGYFIDEGLNIQIKQNAAGWLSLKDLFEGKADIATVAELPVVYSIFDKRKYTETDRPDFYVIGDMIFSQSIIQNVVVRRDRGIATPGDLKGKRIGVFLGTTLDFFMDAFLIDSRVDRSEVEIVNLNPSQMTEAIVKGDVDAIFSWEPHVQIALDKLGDKGGILTSSLEYSTAWLIVVTKDYAQSHPEVLKKFLRAILKAQDFIKENKDASIDIHARFTDVDPAVVRKLCDHVVFDLSLSEAMLLVLEDEADWAAQKLGFDDQETPDVMEYILPDALQAVHPTGMRIIR